MLRQYELVERVKRYDPDADEAMINRAYVFSVQKHGSQKRASGDPYFSHPIEVAGILTDFNLDDQTIVTALLHDTIEDTLVTYEEIESAFGKDVARMVDGVTKLSKIEAMSENERAAENLRKFLLAMSDDIRVLLVKLADRLHNMRTMGAMAPHKARRIARETFDIYAPIAHRLGLNQAFRELQDLSFKYFHPWRYDALSKAVGKARGNRRDLVSRIEGEIRAAFIRAGMRVEVYGREKTVYSIYKKMRDKSLTFAQVSDIYGFRVIADEQLQCYTALGVLHQLYKPQSARFKDYIANPKDNGYQSLHTTLMGPLTTPLEFQVRTEAMHRIAEQGVAAHWIYKTKGKQASALIAQQANARWLQSLIDIQDETRDANEFLEHVKIDLFPDAIYVFTPKSKILALPKGATAVDFAYAIHSDVGDHCVGAQVNGEAVPLRAELHSGDIVEIITAPGATPNPAWLSFVRTGRARSKIRHYLKDLEHEESRDLGEKMLAQALRAEGLALPSLDEDAPTAALWQELAAWAGSASAEQLLTDIGAGRKIATIIATKLARMLADQGQRPDAVALTLGRYVEAPASLGRVTIDGSEGASVQLAHCCRPIPGDAVRGYLGRGEGLVVHTTECAVGRRLFQRDREHWIQVDWAEELTRSFEAGIALLLQNSKGVLAQVASAVAQAEADIIHIAMGDEAAQLEHTEMTLLIGVRDRQHLADVLRVLRRTAPVLRVWRIKPASDS